MIKFLLSQLEILLQRLPPEAAKKAIDAALDAVEKYLEIGGLTAWEKVVMEGLGYIRRALAIEETEGSGYEDK